MFQCGFKKDRKQRLRYFHNSTFNVSVPTYSGFFNHKLTVNNEDRKLQRHKGVV